MRLKEAKPRLLSVSFNTHPRLRKRGVGPVGREGVEPPTFVRVKLTAVLAMPVSGERRKRRESPWDPPTTLYPLSYLPSIKEPCGIGTIRTSGLRLIRTARSQLRHDPG